MNRRIRRFSTALFLCMATLGMQQLNAQSIEFNGFYGWQLAGKFNLYYGQLMLESAPNYGGKMSVGLSSTTHAEISYMRSDSEAWFKPYNLSEEISERFDYSSNYITLAGLQEMDMGRIKPFGTVGMGLVVWSPRENVVDTYVQFHLTLGGGLKFFLNEYLGIRLQGSMMMPMIVDGGGFGCGIGTGGSSCGGAVFTRITPFQGEFSGGIILRIPHM